MMDFVTGVLKKKCPDIYGEPFCSPTKKPCGSLFFQKVKVCNLIISNGESKQCRISFLLYIYTCSSFVSLRTKYFFKGGTMMSSYWVRFFFCFILFPHRSPDDFILTIFPFFYYIVPFSFFFRRSSLVHDDPPRLIEF